jgi:transcription-repair coupling factor (superfamily II helicase)
MKLSHYLLDRWQGDPSFIALQQDRQENTAALVTGLEGSQCSYFIAALYHSIKTTSLVLTSDMVRAERIYEETKSFLRDEEVFLFPGRDFFYAGEMLSQSKEILQQRLKVLEQLALGNRVLIVAPVTALLGKLPPGGLWKKQFLKFSTGEKLEREQLLKSLLEMGYERLELAESGGGFSVRGDIIDIFPFHTPYPVRISFFDEEIESLRYYDPETQRSLKTIPGIVVFPAREFILTEKARQKGLKALTGEMENHLRKLKDNRQKLAADRLQDRVENLALRLENGGYFEGMEQYLSYFYPKPASLTDYLPRGGFLFWDEPESVVAAAAAISKELHGYQAGLLMQGEIMPGQLAVHWSLEEVLSGNNLKTIALSTFSQKVPYLQLSGVFKIEGRSVPNFMGRLDLFEEEIKNWWSQGYEIFFIFTHEGRSQELKELFLERSLPVSQHNVIRGELENGFMIPSLKLVLMLDRNILPGQNKKKRWTAARHMSSLRDFQELKAGDLVVHEQHGIGRYMGIRTLEVNGVTRDYLFIKYAKEDKLFLPVEQMDILQRYTGADGRPPKIYSLGGQDWNRVKNRVKASVQELAKELLSLYAARDALEGFAFSRNHPWEKDFEGRFLYEETPDQLRAITEVQEDMEKTRPMERLLCGDVGYGKTEVALRAAFKAIMDGKQVAFLVPTTILAQQHYNTFLERFQGFPVEVGLLSRFKSAKEQKEVIKGLKAGVVDVVIGTHRVLSKDIIFKDLGLLVIDEEHRFGVRHKEKLKMMRQHVDVLSMTATPIPRTLHMALSGARDLSVIDTPPENRYPIQTYVVEYTDTLLKEAIQRELNRGGQVFFIYNRVQDIEKWLLKLQELVPEARMVVAHGQMPEHQLEKVMQKFLKQEYDILISTTIVEAGLDIPNVNTMIVYDADHFGLAQLYQLRGRVGRSNRLAYCYLTYRKDKVMTGDAVKRLQAVKEFTELGSGFKIALRDLEIRGGGNILGPEQHGFMVAVGYELYCRLLEQAVETMRGKRVERKEDPGPRIDLNVNAYLPSSYVPNQQQKIDLYRRIAILENKEELQDMAEELKDRYGRLQPPVENLLLVMRLRQLAKGISVESIEEHKEQVIVKFQNNFHQERDFENNRLWEIVSRHRKKVSLHAGSKRISLRIKSNHLKEQKQQSLQYIIGLLEEVSEAWNKSENQKNELKI